MLQRFGQACAIIFVACCQSHLNRQQEEFLALSSHKHQHQAVLQDRTGVSQRRTLIRMLRVLVLIFDLSRVSASLGLDEKPWLALASDANCTVGVCDCPALCFASAFDSENL